MGFSSILGQTNVIDFLSRSLEDGRAHHSYRFEGMDGIGKEKTAFQFAQALVCESENLVGCEVCSACTRAITFSNKPPFVPLHPDVILVGRGVYPPEVLGRSRPETQEISVDQIRSVVLSRIHFSPHEGRGRVFIIRNAHELSTSAANALLKTLEEPPLKTYFILITHQPQKLPMTLRSRSIGVRFSPLSKKIMGDILATQNIGSNLLQEVLALAEGSAGKALQLSNSNATERMKIFHDQFFQACMAPILRNSVEFSDVWSENKEILKELLSSLSFLMASQAMDKIFDESQTLAKVDSFQKIRQAISNLERNASPNLTLLSLLSELRDQKETKKRPKRDQREAKVQT